MTRNPYAITWLPAVPADLLALNAADEQLVDTALAALEDIAHHRQCGKLLSKRNVSGDLTGLYRLRFDVPGKRPQRFRIVYRLTPADRPQSRSLRLASAPTTPSTARQLPAQCLTPAHPERTKPQGRRFAQKLWNPSGSWLTRW